MKKNKIIIFFVILFYFTSFTYGITYGLFKTINTDTSYTTSICFSPDDKFIVSGGEDNTVKKWSVQTGQLVSTFEGHEKSVTSVDYSSDSSMIASGSNDNTIKIWNVDNGELIYTFSDHFYPVTSIDFSPDSKFLVSGSEDKTVKIWNLDSGKLVKTLNKHDSHVCSVKYSDNMEFILSAGSWQKGIYLWDANNYEFIKEFNDHTDWISSIDFYNNNETFASASLDNTIIIWNIKYGSKMQSLEGHTSAISSIDFDSNSDKIVSGSWDKSIKIWDSKTGELLTTINAHTDNVLDVCFSNNGEYLASCSKDNTIKIWKGSHVTENIHEYVIEKMKKWQKKGEFEKISDYKKRMEKRNDKVVELTYEALNNLKNEYISTITWDIKIIGDYDAEQETFEIEIPIAGVVALKVPIDDAESFKNNEANLQIIHPDLKFKNSHWELATAEIYLLPNDKSYLYNIKEMVNYDPVNELNLDFDEIEFEKYNEVNITSKDIEDSYNININIPETDTVNADAIAVIIGNSNYTKTKNVDYAINDAISIKEYFMKSFGIKEGNIFLLKNATKGDMEQYFGMKENYKGKLFNSIKPNQSDVFIFYSGHGAPGLKDHKGYFVPVECDPNYVELGGYPLDVFYENLAQIPSKSTTILLDACFSGADIFNDISPITIKVDNPIINLNNNVVLTSSKDDQVSSWYNGKKHGMFTYFLLKAIHNKNADINNDNQVTYEEIYKYISNNSEGIPYYTRRIHGIEQTPTIFGKNKENVAIQY